jgi:hypothetical protein
MRSFTYFALCTLVAICAAAPIKAQSRDYLTDQEIEIVRDAQQIDDRIDVLVHAIDRRLVVLGAQGALSKKEKADVWGDPPAGTRLQLLNDVKRILQKAVDDIDNLAERPDSLVADETASGRKPKGFSELFPKAVRKLAAAAERLEPIFKSQLDSTNDNMEKGVLMDSIDRCEEIAAALTKLPSIMQKAKH